MRLRDEHPSDLVAIALPDRVTCRNLTAGIEASLTRSAVAVLLVTDSGDVSMTGSRAEVE